MPAKPNRRCSCAVLQPLYEMAFSLSSVNRSRQMPACASASSDGNRGSNVTDWQTAPCCSAAAVRSIEVVRPSHPRHLAATGPPARPRPPIPFSLIISRLARSRAPASKVTQRAPRPNHLTGHARARPPAPRRPLRTAHTKLLDYCETARASERSIDQPANQPVTFGKTG